MMREEAAQYDRESEAWRDGRWGDQQQPAVDKRKETPGGRWIKRDVDIHRCPKPTATANVRAGDVWECSQCHTQWRVKGLGYDQRDNDTWLEWEKFNSDSSGMYAPGSK